MDPLLGSIFSHYKILEHLGGGGMGVVYKAEDTRLKRTVALKFLPLELTRDPEAQERFVHEAQAASALQHNNIGTVHDIDQTPGGQLFIVMDFYEGETLKKKIERGPLGVEESLDIAIQISEGLRSAHEHGIIHRDIKPANIMLTSDGVAKVVDFGLAKLSGRTQLTRSGSTLGTAAYMSPEQARGDVVDRRSDIWSLGVLLYEMLTGRKPFEADYENALLYSILNAEPEPLTGLRTGIPVEVERAVQKCMAKAPQDRYQHIDDLVVDLRRAKGESSHGKFPAQARARTQAFASRKVVAAGILLVTVVAAGLWFLGKGSTPRAAYDRMTSIGVLPFVPMNKTSEDTIFAEGIHDDILTQLSKISGLRVIARTSMVRYRDTRMRLSEIGKELDVGYLLEGSVRRAGGRLRITAQLINAETEVHAWANVYERNESDIFAIQSDIATRIADELNVKLSPSERSSIGTPATLNLTARNYYAKGQYYWSNYFDSSGNATAAEMFDSAAYYEPTFVEALAWASVVHSTMYTVDIQWDHTPQRKRRSRTALERAMALAPNAPEVKLAKAHYYRWVEEDKPKALAEFESLAKIRPRWAEVLTNLGALYQELGFFPQARETLRQRRIVEPFPMTGGWESYKISTILREWDVARKEAEEYLAGHPDDPIAYSDVSYILIDGFGDLTGARNVLTEGLQKPVSVFRGGQRVGRAQFFRIELYERRYDSALTCASEEGYYFNRVGRLQAQAAVYRASDRKSAARACLDSVRILLEESIRKGNTYGWNKAALGNTLAALGRYDEGIRLSREAVEESAQGPRVDLFNKPLYEEMMIETFVIGEKHGEAIQLIDELLDRPGTLTVWRLRLDPLYDPLRSDPRFQTLVAGH